MTFLASELTCDGFLGGRLRIWQPRQGYRAGTDPVLLAAFTRAQAGQSVLELGCGVGTAALCLGKRIGGLDLVGLELQPDYAQLAQRNARENNLDFTVHVGDLRAPPADLTQRGFDHVILNPPFFFNNAASPARDTGRDTANREGPAGLRDWLDAALRRVRPKGQVTLIHRAERLGDIMTSIGERGGDMRILPIASRRLQPASRILISVTKNSKSPLTLHPPLIFHSGERHFDQHTDFTEGVNNILKNMSPVLID